MKEEVKAKKYYLKRYRNYLLRIERLKDKLKLIENRLIGLQSVQIKDMPSGGIPLSKDDLFEEKEEIEHRIKRLTTNSKKVKTEIYDCIDKIDDFRFAEILESYFVDNKTLEEIAEDKAYSVQHVGYLYSKALEEIDIRKQ
ncbi:hypothetical protein ACYSNR_02010 [Enterococcus sp. LJL128]